MHGNSPERPSAALVETWRKVMDDHPDIAIGLTARDDDKVEVDCIWSHRERGKGHATRALRALFEIADALDVTLTGEVHWLAYDTDHPLPDETEEELDRLDALNELKLGNRQLLDWYERLGFVPQGEFDEADPLNVVIVRPPGGPVPTPRP